MDTRRAYYDAEPWYQREKTKDWYQQMPKTNDAFQKICKDFLRTESNVLEIACGGGWLAEYILKLNIKRYEGFDFAETAIENANTKLSRFKQACVQKGDALDASFYKSAPNFIIAHQFLHCLVGDDRKKWMNICAASLSKHGKLLLSSMVGIPEQLKPHIDLETKVNKPGNRYYADESEIELELKNAGFQIDQKWNPEDFEVIYLCRRVN